VCVRSCLSYRVSVCVRARACVCRCLCTCIIFLETLQSTGIECIHACTPACMHTYMHGEQGANLDFSKAMSPEPAHAFYNVRTFFNGVCVLKFVLPFQASEGV